MSAGAGIAGAAAIGAVGSIVGGNEQARGAEKAADTQLDMYNQTRADLEPYREIGYQALDVLGAMFIPGYQPQQGESGGRISDLEAERQSLLGGSRGSGGGRRPFQNRDPNNLSSTQRKQLDQWQFEARLGRAGGGVQDTARMAEIDRELASLRAPSETTGPDYSAFYKSPGYNFRFDEGQRAVSRGASARGRRLGGAHERELIRYGQGVASSEFNAYANRLSSIAGLGQTSTAQTGQFGAQAAGQAGQYQQNAGTARGSGYVGVANAATSGISNALYYNQAGGQAGYSWNPWSPGWQ